MSMTKTETKKEVFPAQAGVILLFHAINGKTYGIPRASGGDPYSIGEGKQKGKYSPRKRG